MNARIRPATPADAAAIARIAAEALGEDLDPASPRVRSILESGINFVAVVDERAAGFAHNFTTRDSVGRRRLELDLLAVDRAARGLGGGSALVARSIVAARRSGASCLRALVAADNVAMRALCQRAGLAIAGGRQWLFACHPLEIELEPGPSSAARCIEVDTLAYRGVWLEGALSPGAILEARRRAMLAGATRVGAVIQQAEAPGASLLLAAGFHKIGDYHWHAISF